ncbi:MAG: RNA polymerase sigma factor [Myxococcales bacterium]
MVEPQQARARSTAERELDLLMAQLSAGERTAFDPLFRALYPRAQRLAALRLGHAQAADVAQSALLRVFARASEFRAGSAVLPWFYAIVANEITAARRKRGPLSARESGDDPARTGEPAPELESDPEAQLLEQELVRAVRLAIDELDRPSAEAIAAMLEGSAIPGLTAPAFRKRVSRAYARLRLLLRGSHGD